MWRKQDEPKAPATSLETNPSQPVASPRAPITPVPMAPAIPAHQATAPAGHLTKALVLKGEITGREDLLIDGEVHGQIRIADGRVTIGPGGRVVACIEARDIVVRGKVKGDLRATEHIQICATGSVIGDVVAPRIAIDEGAELRGNVDTTRAGDRQAARVTPSVSAFPPNANKAAESRPAGLPASIQTKEAASGS